MAAAPGLGRDHAAVAQVGGHIGLVRVPGIDSRAARAAPPASAPRSRTAPPTSQSGGSGEGNSSRHTAKAANGVRNSTISMMRGIAWRSLRYPESNGGPTARH